MDKQETLKEIIQEEKSRKIVEKVFDRQTISTLHDLAKSGYFDVLEFLISLGKEAHVFRARDVSGNFRAVKIYKIETSEFKNNQKYLFGDKRFAKTKKTKKDMVYAWAKKEYKNLQLLEEAHANTPKPMAVKNNVLVMDFIGENGIAAKSLREENPKDKKTLEEYYEQTIEFIARGFYLKELIHSDLSEYNILVNKKKLVFIDVGQGVINSHASAKEFFMRDIKNITNYFTRQGLSKTIEEAIEDVKKTGKILKTGKNK